MSHEVFIGYSTPDKKVADAICGILEAKGIPCWIAPRDVPIGRFGGVIVEAVTSSKVMVFLFSEHSNRSANCLTEVHTAFNKGIKMIALRLDDTTPSEDMEYYLQLYHWQDAREPPVEKHFEALVNRVEKELSGIAAKAEADVKKKAQAEEQVKARKAAEEAEKFKETTIKATQPREVAGPPLKAPGRKKPWIWVGSGVLAVAVVAIALVFFMPRGDVGPTETPATTVAVTSPTPSVTTTTPPTTTPTPTTTAPTTTTTPPTTTQPTTTPPTTTTTTPPPAPPTEYVKIDFGPTTFEKTEITSTEPFDALISGNFTCLKDIPYPVTGLTVVPLMTAKNTASGTEIVLFTSNNITSDSIPLKQGETSGFMETLSLQFPDDAENGNYYIYLNTDKIKVNIGLWVDIDEFFQLQKQYLGTVTYNKPKTAANYVEGYIKDAASSAPVADAIIDVVERLTTSSNFTYTVIQASALSDSDGYYEIPPFTSGGVYFLRVTIAEYFTQWYRNTGDENLAIPLTFTDGNPTLTINFSMTKGGTISGKVVSSINGQELNNIQVMALDAITKSVIATTISNIEGTYIIFGLPAGNYYVAATYASGLINYTEYYLNSSDAASATQVTVTAGHDTPNIDFSLDVAP